MTHPAPTTRPSQGAGARVADAPAGNWVDRFAPPAVRPYLRLMRADRPIGAWLLMWPSWWAIALAAPSQGTVWPDLRLLALFGLGAIIMRGAGCTYNDIVDRDFDAKVARTASRPLPSGQVGLRSAWIFLAGLCAAGLAILIQFNPFAIALGAASLALIAAYPFMKRITWWPQIWLGLTFSWGALLGWAAATGELGWPAVALYAGGILWTVGYDTIYAHQDKEDDALIGVKSSARWLGSRTRPWLAGFYGAALACFAVAGALAGLDWVFFGLLAFAALHMVWQIVRLNIDRPDLCLMLFRSNRDFGAILFIAIVAGVVSKGVW